MTDESSSIYLDFIQRLVDGQEARKESIEKRGLSIITTSATLTTLMFGLVAVFTRVDDFELPTQANGPIAAAVALLAIAATLGLATNIPLWLYGNVTGSEMRKRIDKEFSETAQSARIRLAATNVEIFDRAKKANGIKAWLLVAAMVSEVGGVGAVAIAASEIVQNS